MPDVRDRRPRQLVVPGEDFLNPALLVALRWRIEDAGRRLAASGRACETRRAPGEQPALPARALHIIEAADTAYDDALFALGAHCSVTSCSATSSPFT